MVSMESQVQLVQLVPRETKDLPALVELQEMQALVVKKATRETLVLLALRVFLEIVGQRENKEKRDLVGLWASAALLDLKESLVQSVLPVVWV